MGLSGYPRAVLPGLSFDEVVSLEQAQMADGLTLVILCQLFAVGLTLTRRRPGAR